MATHADIGVSQPAASTITMKVATVTLTRNSTAQHQELLTIADPDSTNGLMRVTAGIPDSTMWGGVVRQAPYALTNVTQSTALATSTASVLISSAATTPFVSAFILSSTDAGPIVGGFYCGSTLRWPVTLWAAGGIINVHQQVQAPGYVFSGKAGRPLSFVGGSSGVNVRVGLSYFSG